MKKIAFILAVVIFLAASPAQAQGVPYVIRSTKPISAELRGYLDAWLATDAPSDAPYYIVTYFKAHAEDTVVSLVGVNLAGPDDAWSLDDNDKTVWMGTVTVSVTGEVLPLSQTQARRGGGVLQSLSLEPGGGEYVSFPFAGGSTALYGPRGLHGEGDYGTSGLIAIDLVGGDDMGASSMSPYAYASDTGTVDYICDDGVSVGIRTYNATTGDYFVYAHMLDNDNLEIDHEFARGAMLGSLKYGSFDDDCGWAEQHANHYHVHWMFQPGSGRYQVGSCVLTVSSSAWQCGDQVVRVGGYLTGGGGYSGSGESSGTSGAGSAVTDPTFWDYMLAGFLSIVDRGIVKLLPSHSPFAYTYMVFSTVEIFLRLAWVLVESNINLGPLMTVLMLGIDIKLIFGAIQLGAFLFKAWKSLVPVLGA